MTWEDRIANYERVTGFPRSLFMGGDGRVVGVWIMGNDYRVKSGYHGGYPATYLRRVMALFPESPRTLHLFAGRVDTSIFPGDTLDMNPAMGPTYCCDAHDLSTVPLHEYDLILADPPYSGEDADRYGTPMISRNTVLREVARGAKPGARLLWLDMVHPMYRKDEWELEGIIGIVRSTNHRYRTLAMFRRTP